MHVTVDSIFILKTLIDKYVKLKSQTIHTSKPSQTDNVTKLCYLCKFQHDTLIGSRDIAVYSLVQCNIRLG